MGRKMSVPDANVRAHIADDYTDGMSIIELSAKYGYGTGVIRRVLDIERIEVSNRLIVCGNLNEAEMDEICAIYTEYGISAAEQKTGICASTIHKIRRIRNCPLRPNSKFPPETRAEVARLYSEGMTTKELKKKFRMSAATVWNIAKEYGCKMHPACNRKE